MNKLKTLGVVAAIVVAFLWLGSVLLLAGHHFTKYDMSHITQQQISTMFHSLIRKDVNHSNLHVSIQIYEKTQVNAWISEQKIGNVTVIHIGITRGMLKLTKNKHELAVVLGHEYAHYLLRHTADGDQSTWKPVKSERDADILGQQLATRSGYDGCYAPDLWARFAKKFGNLSGKTHPLPLDRYTSTYCEKRHSSKIIDFYLNVQKTFALSVKSDRWVNAIKNSLIFKLLRE